MRPYFAGPERSGSFRRFAHLDAAHPCRAELELWNLAERIERRIGQQVRCGLRIAERHEYHVLRPVRVRAPLPLDDATPRFQLDVIAEPEAPAPQFLRRHEGNRL